MFLNSTSWTLFPLSLLLYQWDSTLQLQGRLELCCFWVPSIYNPGNFNTKFICRLLANIFQNIMTWIGNFNPEYNGSVRANSSRPPFYLLGWQGTKHSQITAAKSYHEDDHRSWVSWNLNIFLKHSPNTSLNSTDYAPLCKRESSPAPSWLCWTTRSAQKLQSWSDFTHFTFHLSRFVIPEIHSELALSVHWNNFSFYCHENLSCTTLQFQFLKLNNRNAITLMEMFQH